MCVCVLELKILVTVSEGIVPFYFIWSDAPEYTRPFAGNCRRDKINKRPLKRSTVVGRRS